MDFDFIIVGGGSAGCVLASRLSADPANQVLLLEAGGTYQSKFIQIPFLGIFTVPFPLKNWFYFTQKQSGLNNRYGYVPRGKALGGSSSINAMIYTRGQAQDYDDWAKNTSEQWSYASVLPIFKKLEHNHRIQDQYHGDKGELSVNDLRSPNSASQKFVEAGIACGYPHNTDFNGASQHGVGLYQVTQKAGKRHCSASAFLEPVIARSNLTVLTQAHAMQLLMDSKRCIGVRARHKGTMKEFKARKKVILSAGSINSPQLLLLSGIGPREELARHDIACIHELPGVGANLQDHPDYIHAYRSDHSDLMGFTPSGIKDMYKAYLQYKKSATGMMTSNFAEAGGFLSTCSDLSRPDIQLHFVPGIVDNHLHKIHFSRGMSLHFCVLRPKSRGSIRLRSNNPFYAPAIDPNFLAHEDDMQLMLKGYKLSKEIIEHETLAPYRGKNLYPAASDDEIIQLIRKRTDTVYHPVGSCRMGIDELAVVDTRLNVHGIENLLVVDASIMPQLISGNTNAPTMMIAEQAANFLLQI